MRSIHVKCYHDNLTHNTDIFIKKSKEIFGDLYDYSKVDYTNGRTHVEIICSIHGSFTIAPRHHLDSRGCHACAVLLGAEKTRTSLSEFIDSANEIHDFKYNYDLVEYIGSFTPVLIKCKRHGVFSQNPASHLKGAGCPTCSESRGERTIRILLKRKRIKFKPQFKFDDCRNKQELPFDFAIFDGNDNLLGMIEFHGRQHYESIEFFGGIKTFELQQIRDTIKSNYCKSNNIPLLIIPHNEQKNINTILESFMGTLNDY